MRRSVRQSVATEQQAILSKSLGFDLARTVNKGFSSAATLQNRKPDMSHLENIENRQRKSLLRDAVFVALVAIATIVSASTVTTAVQASSLVAHR
jgi:hypothetical protein